MVQVVRSTIEKMKMSGARAQKRHSQISSAQQQRQTPTDQKFSNHLQHNSATYRPNTPYTFPRCCWTVVRAVDFFPKKKEKEKELFKMHGASETSLHVDGLRRRIGLVALLRISLRWTVLRLALVAALLVRVLRWLMWRQNELKALLHRADLGIVTALGLLRAAWRVVLLLLLLSFIIIIGCHSRLSVGQRAGKVVRGESKVLWPDGVLVKEEI
ncbi:hypothetical protein B0H19DRAFT_1114278 [Mycena capillaripes]|nr:hypothetical protein B0H19DRAFT_1114278 [Mycena capillaripes]